VKSKEDENLERIFIIVGATAGVLLVVFILQWLFLPYARTKAKRLYTPQDLLVSIRMETLMELFSLFSPFKLIAPIVRDRKNAQLPKYLRWETRRRRRKQYRILSRMTPDQMKRYDKLDDEEVKTISRRARVSDTEVRELVTDFCLTLDKILQRGQSRTSFPSA